MTRTLRKPTEQGFTIIEVLIVLGIAGLIFSLIFLAIPALIRNSHNNERKQDVSAILAAVSQYGLNNSADFPSPPTVTTPVLLQNSKLSFYDTAAITVVAQPSATPLDQGPVLNIDAVTIYNYAKCNSANNGKSLAASADYRDIAALYAIETSSGPAGQCAQL